MLVSRNGSDLASSSMVALAVTEDSQVGEGRRAGARLARQLGLGDQETGKLALVVTEAAANLVKHAGGGELLLQPLEHDGRIGVEVLALDHGPGLADLERCLRDGFSTAGTPGNGLGAIVRIAGEFDIYTFPQKGTALLARVWAGAPSNVSSATAPMRFGAISVAMAGEPVCGDGWAIEAEVGRTVVLIADGLGHGQEAAAAAVEAIRVFRRNAKAGPRELLETIHAALRSTRGAAVAIADIHHDEETLHFAGIGNIASTILTTASRSLVSYNGTLGHEVRKIHAFTYPFGSDALLVMHSDGLATHWRLEQYSGLSQRDPSLIAGVLFRDFKRGRDDATVLTLRGPLP